MRPILVALYALWAVLWALVAYHYGRAAYASWKAAGGRWSRALTDVAAPFSWAVRQALCRARVLRGAAFCGAEIPSPYYKGHLLRFAIFLGSLTPVMWGFYFVGVDRSAWTAGQVWVNLVGTAVSTLAAGCHLFIAYKTQPGSWTALVLGSMLWLLAAPAVLSALGWA